MRKKTRLEEFLNRDKTICKIIEENIVGDEYMQEYINDSVIETLLQKYDKLNESTIERILLLSYPQSNFIIDYIFKYMDRPFILKYFNFFDTVYSRKLLVENSIPIEDVNDIKYETADTIDIDNMTNMETVNLLITNPLMFIQLSDKRQKELLLVDSVLEILMKDEYISKTFVTDERLERYLDYTDTDHESFILDYPHMINRDIFGYKCTSRYEYFIDMNIETIKYVKDKSISDEYIIKACRLNVIDLSMVNIDSLRRDTVLTIIRGNLTNILYVPEDYKHLNFILDNL